MGNSCAEAMTRIVTRTGRILADLAARARLVADSLTIYVRLDVLVTRERGEIFALCQT